MALHEHDGFLLGKDKTKRTSIRRAPKDEAQAIMAVVPAASQQERVESSLHAPSLARSLPSIEALIGANEDPLWLRLGEQLASEHGG